MVRRVYAYAEATVPKITVITRKAYGGAYIVMNSKPIGSDVNFSYPTAEIAVMGADGAVNILYRKATPEEKAKAVEEYKEKFSNPYRAAEQGYIDEIILPKDTRYKLIQALEIDSEQESEQSAEETRKYAAVKNLLDVNIRKEVCTGKVQTSFCMLGTSIV